MNKTFLALLMAGLLVVSGCAPNYKPDEIKLAPEDQEASGAHIAPESPSSVETSSKSGYENRLLNLTKDAYPDIEIDAFVRERKAILPGSAIPVTVTVKNAGTQTVDYVQGSGGYETPEAVFISAEGLQAVLPKDHLGPVTMDFRTKELKPGETLQFIMYFMAVEPVPNFNAYTLEVYQDGEKYIAESNWPELQKQFPELVPVKPGMYDGHAYFVYYLRDVSGASDFTNEPSGYAGYDFQISVS